jgi:two-component system, NtrC family, nitrogen regulation sensor histidine kinase NtrY
MNAESAISAAARPPRWRRRFNVLTRRTGFVPLLEVGTVALLIAVVVLSTILFARPTLPSPALAATLLVVNLVPAMALMVLLARRLARRRAAQTALGLKSRLPVRLVAIFSVIASVPTFLVVIFASLLFQYGMEFFFSDRARGMLENAASLAQDNYDREADRVGREAVAMAGDLASELRQMPIDSQTFAEAFAIQVYRRNLSEAIILRVGQGGAIQSLALVNPYDRPLDSIVTPQMIAQVRPNAPRPVISADRFGALVVLPFGENTYIYTARVIEPELATQLRRGAAVLADYQTLASQSRDLQLRFNAALFALSLLVVGVSIFIALRLADRLVQPVGRLVDAARRVTAGDLSVRVPVSEERDEVGTLGNAFNRMTKRLEEQTGALVAANDQLESRRAFIEAVLSGVTAGVISVDEQRVVRLINRSAEALLRTDGGSAVGQKLADLAPELDQHLTADEREDVVQLATGGEPRTLAVKTVQVEGGQVLTFDDITEQLLDQRRAAWSDVARRIAHEIKNPLTPIQLAAERLQRRYATEVASDPATFERLTGTIVRQVGDLRRMVDEFSSFARMPKPTFHEEPVNDIVRHAVFLHEVAHPDIDFSFEAPDPSPMLVCDRRLLGQAVTNVVKNGVEAIQQKRDEGEDGRPDRIAVTVSQRDGKLRIDIYDSGIGLPADRGRLTEPYMTTRIKGTGLGLAIVKKIVEEHFGQIEFEDAPGGGSLVRFAFDVEVLRRLSADGAPYTQEASG